MHLVTGEIRVGQVLGLGDIKILKGWLIFMGNLCTPAQAVKNPLSAELAPEVSHIQEGPPMGNTHWDATKLPKKKLNLRFEVRTPPQVIMALLHKVIGPTSVSQPSGEAVTWSQLLWSRCLQQVRSFSSFYEKF